MNAPLFCPECSTLLIVDSDFSIVRTEDKGWYLFAHLKDHDCIEVLEAKAKASIGKSGGRT